MRALNQIALLSAIALASIASADERSSFRPPKIRVPKGFELKVAAAPPLVKHPMMGCLDDRGRLFVAETDGRNLKKEPLLREKPRFIRMLEDTNGDGEFDKSTIFADKMVMPEGALWHDGALYVLSAPYLWRLEDTDDDGVADRRDKLVGKFNVDGRPNQHGPYLGPCGRIYFSGGIFGYDLRGTDGSRTGKSTAGSVFSCWPDGSDVEVFGQGPLNPVEVTFSPEGEMFGTAAIFDNFGGRHDALIHWVRGAVTAKQYGGPLLVNDSRHRLPALSRWGQVAPAGLARYRSMSFGDDFVDNLFSCHFNTRRVIRTRVRRYGATYHSVDEDFLASDNVDFHPTDVIEDADGSLLVIDTGGWLYFGCPTSKIAKPNVLGAIYRVRRVAAGRASDPRGSKINWDRASTKTLTALLNDPRPAVRDRSMALLRHRGKESLTDLRSAIESNGNVRLRRNAVWVCARIRSSEANSVIRAALDDVDPTVRHAAVHSVGTLRDVEATSRLIELLRDKQPHVRRASATALARLGRKEAVPNLLAMLAGEDNDDFLDHAAIHALISINDESSVLEGLEAENVRVRRGALIALDEMKAKKLTAPLVLKTMGSGDQTLRKTAFEIIARHQEWAEDVAMLVQQWCEAKQITSEESEIVRSAIASLSGNPKIRSIVADAISRESTPSAVRLLLLDAIASSPSPIAADALAQAIGVCLAARDPEVAQRAVALAWQKDASLWDDKLIAMSRRKTLPVPLRLMALATAVRHSRPLSKEDFELLTRQFEPRVLPTDRLRAADALVGADLNQDQTEAVSALLAKSGPLELPVLLKRFERFAAPSIVNIDVQSTSGKAHRGKAAVGDDPAGAQAVWNAWTPGPATGAIDLRTSLGAYTNISVGRVEGAKLFAHQVDRRFDRLLDDFFFNGPAEGGGKHQAYRSWFRVQGLDHSRSYEVYFYGSASAKDPPRGASVTVTDNNGRRVREIDGLRQGARTYQIGRSHAVWQRVKPRRDGTIDVEWTASARDEDGNYGVFNGLTIASPALPQDRDRRLGKRLVASLSTSPGIENIPHTRVATLLSRFPKDVLQEAKGLLEKMKSRQRHRVERLDQLMKTMKGHGDIRRGREIFFANRSACSTCHRVRGRGGDIGPDLTRIGKIRTDRDLVESIMFPSSTIVNGFETYSVVMRSGRTAQGVLSRETPRAIFLQAAGKPATRIERSDIEEMNRTNTSIMPDGLQGSLSTAELRDLIAFLRSVQD